MNKKTQKGKKKMKKTVLYDVRVVCSIVEFLKLFTFSTEIKYINKKTFSEII